MGDSDNDSDNFYDAEEIPYSPDKTKREKPTEEPIKVERPITLALNEGHANHNLILKLPEESNPVKTKHEPTDAERKVIETEIRRRKFEEKLRKLNAEEEENQDLVYSESSSVASSLDVVYSHHITMDDKQSVVSLGKVGALLGDKDDLSLEFNLTLNKNAPEPDLVASTKAECLPPIAPPRKKDKRKKKLPSSLSSEKIPSSNLPLQGLPSPTLMVENLAKELEKSLDLESATRGKFVVKPQDREQDHGEWPTALKVSSSTGKNSNHSSGGSHKSGSSDKDNAVFITPDSTTRSMKMRSDSGRQLTDIEILEQVQVRNLDTGELIPLSQAEDRLPQCLNPLSLHIMRLTSEYVSNPELNKRDSDEESITSKKSASHYEEGKRVWHKTKRIQKMIGKRFGETVHKFKQRAEEVRSTRNNEELETSEEDLSAEAKFQAKTKASNSHKGPCEFANVRIIQELEGEHQGAIWTMKFSSCGRLLATAGQDHSLRIWVLNSAFQQFSDMRQQADGKNSLSESQETLNLVEEPSSMGDAKPTEPTVKGPFRTKPFCIYHGHTADLLDVSWSKNNFILSSSMDKTVRLWHISRRECLCCFQHIDFVTAIAFHPRDDRYFLSGSLDGKLRLWNIPDKKVALWNELDGRTKLITSVSFCQNGKYAVVGSYDGRCVFYNTDQLKYFTQIHVRSSRGKNKDGRKITCIEPMPGEDKILVTSNDSRIRLYDHRDLSLVCKYKGYVNMSSQIKASFSHDGKYIISGSENQFIYIWKVNHDMSKLTSVRRDRNDYWESIKAHDYVVTTAVFAPNPTLILQQADLGLVPQEGMYVLVSADFNGTMKVMVNKCPPGISTPIASGIIGIPPPTPNSSQTN